MDHHLVVDEEKEGKRGEGGGREERRKRRGWRRRREDSAPGVDAGLGDVPHGRGLHDVPDHELPDGLVLGAALGRGG